MGTSKSGRYLNTKGSGRNVSDFALVHSSEGAFTRSQTRVNGKMVIKLRLNNGGRSRKGMELLDKYGIINIECLRINYKWIYKKACSQVLTARCRYSVFVYPMPSKNLHATLK